MISDISSSYRVVYDLFDFSKETTADVNKKILLGMATNNENRPPVKTKIGMALSNYTLNGSSSYDPNFTKQIKDLRPDWFVSSLEKTNKNKKILLEMAKNGEKRPLRKTKLGDALTNYITKSNKSYDASFAKKIRKSRPDWFYSPSSNKKILLQMAINGENRPSRKTKIGMALCNYTRESCVSFDCDFAKKIKKIAPNWFVKSSSYNKEILLKLAKKGENKPKSKSKLGNLLYSYTLKSSETHDPIFTEKIKDARPDWFKK